MGEETDVRTSRVEKGIQGKVWGKRRQEPGPQCGGGEGGTGTTPSPGLLTQMAPSLVPPRNAPAHCYCCCLCLQPSPPPAVRRAAAAGWFPHPRGSLAKYSNDSVSGRGAAGRLPSPPETWGWESWGWGSLAPLSIVASPTFRPKQAQKGSKSSLVAVSPTECRLLGS